MYIYVYICFLSTKQMNQNQIKIQINSGFFLCHSQQPEMLPHCANTNSLASPPRQRGNKLTAVKFGLENEAADGASLTSGSLSSSRANSRKEVSPLWPSDPPWCNTIHCTLTVLNPVHCSAGRPDAKKLFWLCLQEKCCGRNLRNVSTKNVECVCNMWRDHPAQ